MKKKTCRTPVGIVKDVLIHIDKLSFPIDFVILDVKEDPIIPLISGIPFTKTTWMLVYIYKGGVNVKNERS